MTLTHEIYKDLINSILDGECSGSVLTNASYTSKGLTLIYGASKNNQKRSFYFAIDKNNYNMIPQCRGIETSLVQLSEYSKDETFCALTQTRNSEDYIFEIIIEDIRRAADEINEEKDLAASAAQILGKWKNFFAAEKSVVMAAEKAQGLYGELYFLKTLLSVKGPEMVNTWTGGKYETHDFYMNDNAVEVKTTSNKAPFKMHISSEYQLDNGEVKNSLFLNFYALRKSETDGQTLPELIDEIRSSIRSNIFALKKFNTALQEYGYFDGTEDKYLTGYTIRESKVFEVNEGFPRILAKQLAKGISNCTYDLLVDICAPFEVELQTELEKLEGSEQLG